MTRRTSKYRRIHIP